MIWVEGYKATDVDMRCRNDFQYELGKKYICEGEPIKCHNGFHFCLNLKDVMNWNDKGRYFKVKALVSKKDYENKGYDEVNYIPDYLRVGYYYYSNGIPKLVAKEIILLEEIPYEIFSIYQGDILFVNNYEDYMKYIRDPKLYYYENFKNKMNEHLYENPDYKLTDEFIKILFERVNDSESKYLNIIELADALKKEHVSKDLLIKILLKETRHKEKDKK